MRINTTLIDRENTNQNIFDRTNQGMEEENTNRRKKKKVVPFVEACRMLKLKRASSIISKLNSLIHNITFNCNRIRKWIQNGRRVGRPRYKWVSETVQDVWNNTRHLHQHIPQIFDNQNAHQHEAVNQSLIDQSSAPAFLYS